MPIFIVEPGHKVVTPLSIDKVNKRVEKLDPIPPSNSIGAYTGISSTALGKIYTPGQKRPEYRADSEFSYDSSQAAKALPVKNLLARDIMSSPLLLGEINWSVTKGLEFIKEHDITHLPLRDKNKLVGLINERDLLYADTNQENDIKRLITPFIIVGHETTLTDVALVMLFKNSDAVLVKNNHQDAIGLISQADFLKAFAHIEYNAWI